MYPRPLSFNNGESIRVALFLFLFNFVIKVILKLSISLFGNINIDIYSDNQLSALLFAGDIVLLDQDREKLELFLGRLKEIVAMFGKPFVSSK